MSVGRSIGRDAARESDPKAAAYDAALLQRLWKYLRPYAALAAASLSLLMANSALGVAWPLLTQVAVDRYLRPDSAGALETMPGVRGWQVEILGRRLLDALWK